MVKACLVMLLTCCSTDKTRPLEITHSLNFENCSAVIAETSLSTKWEVCSLHASQCASASSLKSRMSQLSVISRELVQGKVAHILLTMALGLIRKYNHGALL